MSKCTYCESESHTSIMCFNKPRKPLKAKKVINRFGKAAAKWIETKNEWIQRHPPDEFGVWVCYLQISPLCPKYVNIDNMTLDHVKGRGSHPELKYELSNLKPCCFFCNGLKGSRSIEVLARDYPQLEKYL